MSHGHDQHPLHSHGQHGPTRPGACCAGGHGAGQAATVRDPVCGMAVDPADAKGGSATHGGQAYHFCSSGCRAKFEADPARYLQPETASAAAPAPEGAIYTCPMHPQIRQDHPGTCPLCGMALEPAMPAAAGADA